MEKSSRALDGNPRLDPSPVGDGATLVVRFPALAHRVPPPRHASLRDDDDRSPDCHARAAPGGPALARSRRSWAGPCRADRSPRSLLDHSATTATPLSVTLLTP